MDSERKPCPWCNGTPNTMLVRHPVKGWQVQCMCGVRGPGYSDTASAVAAWNTRALEQREAGSKGREGWVLVPREALLEVLRISDREHDAWRAVKDALAAAPSGEGE